MTGTFTPLAPSKLTEGMIIRQTVNGVDGHYEVIEVIPERMKRKLYVHTVCKPLDDAHAPRPIVRPLFRTGNRPMVKTA